jgi:hypothetical protein
MKTVATHAPSLHRAADLILQMATEFASIGSMFSPSQRSNRAQKISSQLCDGSIKAEHGTLSMISSIAPAARL